MCKFTPFFPLLLLFVFSFNLTSNKQWKKKNFFCVSMASVCRFTCSDVLWMFNWHSANLNNYILFSLFAQLFFYKNWNCLCCILITLTFHKNEIEKNNWMQWDNVDTLFYWNDRGMRRTLTFIYLLFGDFSGNNCSKISINFLLIFGGKNNKNKTEKNNWKKSEPNVITWNSLKMKQNYWILFWSDYFHVCRSTGSSINGAFNVMFCQEFLLFRTGKSFWFGINRWLLFDCWFDWVRLTAMGLCSKILILARI